MLLLDSHVVLWWLLEPMRISEGLRQEISQPKSHITVSVASVWEIEIKRHAGRLSLPVPTLDALELEQFDVLPIAAHHAAEAAALPLHHRDPFDRMLVAQARVERLTLVSSDREIARYDVTRVDP